MGDGYLSMIISIVRQIFVLIPVAWLLGRIHGLHTVWYTFAIAEVFALVLSVFFFFKEKKKMDF